MKKLVLLLIPVIVLTFCSNTPPIKIPGTGTVSLHLATEKSNEVISVEGMDSNGIVQPGQSLVVKPQSNYRIKKITIKGEFLEVGKEDEFKADSLGAPRFFINKPVGFVYIDELHYYSEDEVSFYTQRSTWEPKYVKVEYLNLNTGSVIADGNVVVICAIAGLAIVTLTILLIRRKKV